MSGVTTCESEKYDKQTANRRLRVAMRGALASDADVMPALREVSDTYCFGKDGKRWWGDRFPTVTRK
ncbi:MAG: hypothetical protein NTX56_04230 [Proteobacteria bacterium]|nr:hypothetical protein [Pseudomonadota bacterium]